MNHVKLIASVLDAYAWIRPQEDGFLIGTHCLFPGGDAVCVKVMVSPSGYCVTDDGLGWSALLDAGIDPSHSQARRAHAVADELGLTFAHGTFIADEVDQGQVGAAIVTVANASQRWVHEVIGEQQRRTERDLRRRIFEYLGAFFPVSAISADTLVAGESTKRYQVAQTVKLGDRMLLVEPVINQPNSIAAVFMKFADISRAQPDWPREAVIQDIGRWKSEDVNVLSEVSSGVVDIETALEPIRRKYAA